MSEMLRLQDVSCTRHGQRLIDRLNLVLDAGQMIAIRGARGSGKSTLMAIAAASLRPGAGHVFIAERDILALQAGSLPFVRRNIGYLGPEPPLLLEATALENVMLALAVRGEGPREARVLAAEAMAALGLPEALASVKVSALSWSERRLVAMARAIVGTPPLVVLDDPAVGLDARDRERVSAALSRLASAGAAILCASAEASFTSLLLAAGAQVLDLEQGRLVGERRMTLLRGRATPEPAEEPRGRTQKALAADADGEPDVQEPDEQELDAVDFELIDDVKEGRP